MQNFYLSSNNKGGYATCCKKCSIKRNAASRLKNIEKNKADKKIYKEVNREKIRIQAKKYRIANRDKNSILAKERRAKKRASWTEEEWAEFRSKRLEGKRIRRAKKYGNGGRHSQEEWDELLSLCDGRCVKCGTTETISRDHIIPLSKGRLATQHADSLPRLQQTQGELRLYRYRPPDVVAHIAKLYGGKKCCST